MEIFIDFGLFELLAAVGIGALARVIYLHKISGVLFLVASVALPAALIFIVQGEAARWLSALTLGTALVNATVVGGALQNGDVRTPKMPSSSWITRFKRGRKRR